MLRYTLRRVPSAVIVLAVSSVLVFLVLRLAPGDPAVLVAGPDAGPETIAAARARLGLDDSLIAPDLAWMAGLVAGGRSRGWSLPARDLARQSLVMPAVCLALPAAAVIARFLAASMRQVRDEDFIRTGVAKGLRQRRLTMRHVVPNAIPPVLT